jgi:hypothetical protein
VGDDLTYPESFRLGVADPAIGQRAYLRLYLSGARSRDRLLDPVARSISTPSQITI